MITVSGTIFLNAVISQYPEPSSELEKSLSYQELELSGIQSKYY